MKNNLAIAARDGRMLSGPESTRAAQALAERSRNQESWPYPWVYPPANAKRRNPSGSLAIPGVSANYSTIFSFAVPVGFTFLLDEVFFSANVTGYIPGSGDLLWRIDVDNSPDATQLTASPLPDFAAVSFPFGPPMFYAPFRLPRAESIASGQVLRVKVRAVGGNTGAPNYTCALLGGWLVPAVK